MLIEESEDRITKWVQELRGLHELPEPPELPDPEWLSMMNQMCPDPDHFVAGGLTLAAEAWKEYFRLTGNKVELAGRVCITLSSICHLVWPPPAMCTLTSKQKGTSHLDRQG